MKITRFQLFNVPPRWLFLTIETDEGIVGWGEPVIEGRTQTTRTAVTEPIKTSLMKKNPLLIEDHWQTMYRGGFYRSGPVLMSAIAEIDQALWNIKGKYYNAPIYELLSEKIRDKLQIYSWAHADNADDFLEEVKKLCKKGYRAFKMNAVDALALNLLHLRAQFQ